MNNAPLTARRASGNLHTTWIVAEREITTRLRSKAFLISTGLLLLFTLAAVLFAGFSSSNGGFGSPTKVAVLEGSSLGLTDAGYEVTEVQNRDAAEELVRSEEVTAAVVPGGDSVVGLSVIALESAPSGLVQALSATPDVVLLDPTADNPFLAYIIGIAFGVMFMMTGMTFGMTIAQSVVEEKQTRIVEILLATVPARTLLAGKILGNSILALGTVVAVIAVASVGMLATGQDLLLGELGTGLIWFGILFAFGFVLLATMYAALAALVSRQEDLGSATSPMMVLLMAPYILVIMFAENQRVLAVMSYVPFSAPVGMPMRLYLGVAEWWEPFLSLGILCATIALVLWVGARIYRNSILRTGVRVSLKDALVG